MKFHRKKAWCVTRSHTGTFWGQIGRGRCRPDCDGKNLESSGEANLANEVL